VPVSKYLSCGTVLSYLLSDVWFNFTNPWLSNTTQYEEKLSRSCRCPSSLVESHKPSATIMKMGVVLIPTETFRRWDVFLASLHRSKPALSSGYGGVFHASSKTGRKGVRSVYSFLLFRL
jgi:hypothetical protein